ncbi:hypothetical protein, partial [Clostridium botulinum]
MKKLICLLHHPLRLTKTTDCNTEDFENDNRTIRIYKCKYCGKDILVTTRCINGKFCKPFNHSKDFNFNNQKFIELIKWLEGQKYGYLLEDKKTWVNYGELNDKFPYDEDKKKWELSRNRMIDKT